MQPHRGGSLTSDHELVPNTPSKYLANPFHQLPSGREICLHRLHQWKSQSLFFQAQLVTRKQNKTKNLTEKDICFYFKPFTNWLLWNLRYANKWTSYKQKRWLSIDSCHVQLNVSGMLKLTLNCISVFITSEICSLLSMKICCIH